MKVVFGEAKLIKKLMDTVSSIVEDALIVIDENGLTLKALNEGGQVMIDVFLNRDAFLEYEIKESEKVNIDLLTFNKVLKRATNKDKVIIIFKEDRQYIMIGTSDRKFDIPLYDVPVDEARIKSPVVKFKATIEFEPKILSEAIKDVLTLSEKMVFEVTSDSLLFKNGGHEIHEGTVKFELIKDMCVSFNVEKPCISMFKTEYLKNIIKANGTSGVIKLSVGTDVPALFEYNSPVSSMKFFVVPWIEQ